MKRRYWSLSIFCSFFSAAALFLALWIPTQYQVPVVMYHTIAAVSPEPLNNVTPQRFAAQMSYLKKHGYKVISAQELVEGLRSGREFDRKSVVITFDDGYENNYTEGYPLLKARGFPATFFVEVGHLDRPGRLTWAQAREMSSNGMGIQSHLMTGAYLPNLALPLARQEIVQSKELLEKNLGRPVEFLAYPIGGFSEQIKQLVRDSGYQAAFATNRGYDRKARDLYELKRIRLKDTDGDAQLWLKLSGYYNLFRRSKHPH